MTCYWLGINYASIKVQSPSQAPVPRSGTVTNIEGGVNGLVSQDRWENTQRLIEKLVGTEQEGREGIPRDRMESIRILLVYVYRKYRDINPYLKGANLTLDSWRSCRDQ